MNININNLNHKRIMTKIYNKFIEWTLSAIAVICYIPLVIIKITMRIIVKIAKAIIFVVNEIFIVVGQITEGLIERLSVRD